MGEDQVQHVEFTREVARHFNARYGDTFPECEALLTATPQDHGPGRRGQDEQEQGQHHRPAGDPGADLGQAARRPRPTRPACAAPIRARRRSATIWSYHQLVTPEPQLSQIVAQGCRTAGIGCIDCKKLFLDNLMKELDPIRERYQELAARPRARCGRPWTPTPRTCRADARAHHPGGQGEDGPGPDMENLTPPEDLAIDRSRAGRPPLPPGTVHDPGGRGGQLRGGCGKRALRPGPRPDPGPPARRAGPAGLRAGRAAGQDLLRPGRRPRRPSSPAAACAPASTT